MELSLELKGLYQKYGQLYTKGHLIFQEGDPADELFLILAGEVRIEKKIDDAQTKTLAILKKGDFFGEIGLLVGGLRTASALAETPVRLLRLKKDVFEQCITRFPQLAKAVLRTLSVKLKTTTEKLTQEEEETDVEKPTEANIQLGKPDENPIDPKKFFRKKIRCPLCQKSFSTVLVRRRAYMFQGRDTDFMPRYQGANPLFYAVWICPGCFYAGYKADFHFLPPALIRKIKANYSVDGKELQPYSIWGERDAQSAAKAYEIATACALAREARASILGSLYLRQAWMFRLQKKGAEENFFLEKAVSAFEKAIEHEDLENTKLRQVGVLYLIAELNRRLHRLEKALKWFSHVVQDPALRQRKDLERLTQDELLLTKQSLKEKKAGEVQGKDSSQERGSNK